MNRHVSHLDMATLAHAITALPTTVDDGNVHMVYDQGTDPEKVQNPYIRKAIREIEILTGGKAVGVMVNTLKAGQYSPIHTDKLTGKYDRFHLPVQTNEHAYWWDATLPLGKLLHMREGTWYGPVPYYHDHRVFNDGKQDRIHIVVDIKGAGLCLRLS